MRALPPSARPQPRPPAFPGIGARLVGLSTRASNCPVTTRLVDVPAQGKGQQEMGKHGWCRCGPVEGPMAACHAVSPAAWPRPLTNGGVEASQQAAVRQRDEQLADGQARLGGPRQHCGAGRGGAGQGCRRWSEQAASSLMVPGPAPPPSPMGSMMQNTWGSGQEGSMMSRRLMSDAVAAAAATASGAPGRPQHPHYTQATRPPLRAPACR